MATSTRSRNLDEVVPRFRELAAQFPMGSGKVVVVDTTNEIDVRTVLDALASWP